MNLVKKAINEIVNLIFTVILAILIFVLIRRYVVQPFQVEGNSMEPVLMNHDQMLMMRQVNLERFDVVVFPDPRGSGESYVKRIIGLPGDQVEVKDDVLYLNQKACEEPYLEPYKSDYEGNYTEDFTLWDTLGIEAIPAGYYFVMGDNRPYSGDSRQFGLVAEEHIQGEADFIYYPLNRFGQINQYTISDTHRVVKE